MTDIRTLYLETAAVAQRLLASEAVSDGWQEASALPHFRVAGLAGHLARATGTTVQYLGNPEPPAPSATLTAAHYFAAALALATDDLASDLHTNVRRQGEEWGGGGAASTAAAHAAHLAQLGTLLAEERSDRRVAVFHGLVLRLDDYLGTRLVEVVLHVEDLALSVGAPVPELPNDATAAVIATLVDVAKERYGSWAVLHALARRERDRLHAFPVI